MNARERDILIEASVTAFRERDVDGNPAPPPQWWDLEPAALDELYRRQLEARELERALDPAGETATVKAVLARI